MAGVITFPAPAALPTSIEVASGTLTSGTLGVFSAWNTVIAATAGMVWQTALTVGLDAGVGSTIGQYQLGAGGAGVEVIYATFIDRHSGAPFDPPCPPILKQIAAGTRIAFRATTAGAAGDTVYWAVTLSET